MNDVATLPELIASVGGIVITLALAYGPGLKEKWAALSGEEKRAWLAGLYLLISAGMYIPSCFGGPQVVACDTSSIWDVIFALILALISSQGMYQILPQQTKQRMSNDEELA